MQTKSNTIGALSAWKKLLPVCAFMVVAMSAPEASAKSSGDLPQYSPEYQVSGTIRNYGFSLGGVLGVWQEEFKKIHPAVEFENTLPTSDAAFPALVTGQTDLAPDGGEPAITEWLSFYETHGYHATSIVVATGSFDREGRSNGPVVLVHKDNPISKLTIDQLDGIFGSQRNGTMAGFVWSPEGARGADDNIRKWGQLGLKGKWRRKKIQTYGHASSGTTRFFQLHVLGNTDKWNPNYRGYVESGSKMMSPTDVTHSLGIKSMLNNELSKNKYGIAWTIMSQAEGVPGVKVVAIAPRGSHNYVMPSRESFQDGSYPLARKIYIYLDRKPGTKIDPKLKEFLRYVLSAQGQKSLEDAGYLPLTKEAVLQQLRNLD